MNDLIINADQQSGTYKGRRVVAVASEELCAGCIVNADGGNAFECKDTLCREEERKDGQYIHWLYAPADPAPTDTVCKRCGGGGMVGDYLDVRSCPDCDMAFKVNLQRERLRYANGGLDTAPSDTAMLDYLLEHCTCLKEWKTGRDAFESRDENKPLRTREDVRRAMGGGK